jgi:putative transposase
MSLKGVTMKKPKYPVDKIIQILAEAELPTNSIADVCRKYNIARSTFDKWRKQYKGFSSNEAQRLKILENENLRLKKLLAEKELEIQVLSDIVKKNFF